MDLTDTPDVEDAADDPGGFAMSSFLFMATVGVVIALIRLANRYIAQPAEDAASSVITGVTNAANEADTGTSFSDDDFL